MTDRALTQLAIAIQAFMVVLLRPSLGEIMLIVSPYPARIYQGAPADVPVLTVQGNDNLTGARVSHYVLDYVTMDSDAKFFTIDSNGVIKTNTSIDFAIGHELKFFVAGFHGNQTNYKHVEIVVSVKNMHAPKFSRQKYSFNAYQHGIGDDLGQLDVTDADQETYNREVTVFAEFGQMASAYVEVDSNRHLRLIQSVPDHVTTLNMTVLAMDEGSPQLNSTAEVEIQIVRFKQPAIFCLSITKSTVSLCWKNPMPNSYFDGYNLTVIGQFNRTVFLPALEGHTEACFAENNTNMTVKYEFKVGIQTTEPTFGRDFSVKFDNKRKGVSKECESEGFSVCSYRTLCNDHGKCTTTTSNTNYTCLCDIDWRGRNCESQDLCAYVPCENNGICEFKGHQEYKCDCLSGYYGDHCQYIDQCLDLPCQNNGTCMLLNNGTYRCDCPPQISGNNCQTRDPCFPMPCVAGRGACLRVSESEFKCECFDPHYGDRCEHTNVCLHGVQRCNYQGTCIPVGDSFECVCPPGSTGRQCEYLEPCSLDPCRNNATCSSGSMQGTYRCNCLPGYYGYECQNYNLCQDVNCNNGTCEPGPVNGTRCQCNRGFYGNNCDQFDVCLTSPCNEHGTCSSSGLTLNNKDNFTCNCSKGWTGLTCNVINYCTPDVCKNGGTCQNVPRQGYRCICREGYYLDDCSAFNPCSDHLCRNGAVCQNVSQESYVCKCQKDWFGNYCEHESPCSVKRNPCQNNGRCQIMKFGNISNSNEEDLEMQDSPESYSATCDCPTGYFGPNCQIRDPCLSSPCVHGNCSFLDVIDTEGSEPESGGYTCSCYQNFTGRHCHLLVNQSNNIRCFNGGECVDGACVCPPDFTGRFCEQELPVCQETDLENQADQHCTVDKAMKNLRDLLDGTSEPAQLSAQQVLNYTDQLINLYNHTLRDTKYAWTAFCVLGNLAKVNLSVSEEVQGTGNVNSRLLEFLDNYTSEVKLEDGTGEINVTAPELQVKVISVERLMDLDKGIVLFEPYVTENNTSVELNLEIKIPASVLIRTNNGTSNTRIQFIGYKRSQLFVPTNGFQDDTSLHNQPVISATVGGREISNLTTPVEIRLLNITPGRKYACVFWDPEGSTWSREGVSVVHYDDASITCASTHLTSFAILLDVNSERTVSQEHEKILTYLTYIGCAISTSCLVITLVTYIMFKCLNNEKSGKILIQLCAALLMLNIAFLVGTVDVSGYSKEGCLVVGMLLHYLLLSALMWMLVEAVEMYQALVTVFSKYERMYLLKRCLLAWGIPVIIVAITAGVDSYCYYREKEERQFCFLTSKSTAAYYASLVAPSCAILLVNSFVFIMVARVILKPNFQQQLMKNTTSVTPAQIRGAFTVMFLLGITWVFGPLAVNEAQTVFSYFFCICNSLQGFLIFVFRCLLNPEAKMAWLQLVHTGTLKRKRGPIKSVYTDSTSKGGDIRRGSSSNTSGYIGSQTTRTSLSKNGFHPHPHQLHKTNGWHPSLNGLKRDKTQQEDTASFSVGESRTHEGNISSEYSFKKKSEALPDEAMDTLKNEQTHF